MSGEQRASVDKDAGSQDKDPTAGESDENVTPMPPANPATESPAPPSRLAWAAPPAARAVEGVAESQRMPTVAATPAHFPWLLRSAGRGGVGGRVSASGGVVLPPHAMPEEASSTAAASATLYDVAVDVDSDVIASPAASARDRRRR